MVTLAQLEMLYPRAASGHLGPFASQATALFNEFGIAQLPNRPHFFRGLHTCLTQSQKPA